MGYLEELKPGKRENACYVPAEDVDYGREGEYFSHGKEIHIYVWDPVKKVHVEQEVRQQKEYFDDSDLI